MNDFGAGYVIGFVIGLACGFLFGRKHKPWSELTEKEKKIMIGIIVGLAVLVILTAIAVLLTKN